MSRRMRDSSGCTLLLTRVLLWIFAAEYTHNQELPSSDTDYAFGINQKNVFYDNNRIPSGVEVSPYLYFNTTKKFFLLLESKIDRLEITVTPCASPIIWHVTHQPLKQRGQNYDLGSEVQSSLVGSNATFVTKPVLFTQSGEIAETLTIDSPTEGIYTVDLKATKSDSYVQIFATTQPDLSRYPDLPTDNNINQSYVTENKYTFSWNPSPDELAFGDDIEYCVAINRKRSYKTLCSALSHLHGDPKPTLPPGNGFGFADKKRDRKHKAKPIMAEKNGSIYYNCIGREVKFVFNNVKKVKGLYVDVFIRNTQSGRSRYYNGKYIKTKRKNTFAEIKEGELKHVAEIKEGELKHVAEIKEGELKHVAEIKEGELKHVAEIKEGELKHVAEIKEGELKHVAEIKEGELKHVVFSRKKSKQTFTYVVKNLQKEVHISMNSCPGPVDLQVRANNVTFHKAKIKDSKDLTLNNIGPGVYDLELTKSVPKTQNVYIALTKVAKNVQIPALPLDSTVKIFDYMTSCHSVTVALTGTGEKEMYCLYKTELNSDMDYYSGISKKVNKCGALNRNKHAKKITCKTFRYRKKDRDVLAITVTGLKPDTGYIFDVFVKKGNAFSFPYNSVRTKTSSECSPSPDMKIVNTIELTEKEAK